MNFKRHTIATSISIHIPSYFNIAKFVQITPVSLWFVVDLPIVNRFLKEVPEANNIYIYIHI